MSGITHYERAVDDLFHNQLHETVLSELKTTPKKHLIIFHMSLGQCIRVMYDMWQNEELVASTGTKHPDEASMFIIVKLWEYLQGVDIPILLDAEKPTEAEYAPAQKMAGIYENAMNIDLSIE